MHLRGPLELLTAIARETQMHFGSAAVWRDNLSIGMHLRLAGYRELEPQATEHRRASILSAWRYQACYQQEVSDRASHSWRPPACGGGPERAGRAA